MAVNGWDLPPPNKVPTAIELLRGFVALPFVLLGVVILVIGLRVGGRFVNSKFWPAVMEAVNDWRY